TQNYLWREDLRDQLPHAVAVTWQRVQALIRGLRSELKTTQDEKTRRWLTFFFEHHWHSQAQFVRDWWESAFQRTHHGKYEWRGQLENLQFDMRCKEIRAFLLKAGKRLNRTQAH